jgi:hypothetical protein
MQTANSSERFVPTHHTIIAFKTDRVGGGGGFIKPTTLPITD